MFINIVIAIAFQEQKKRNIINWEKVTRRSYNYLPFRLTSFSNKAL